MPVLRGPIVDRRSPSRSCRRCVARSRRRVSRSSGRACSARSSERRSQRVRCAARDCRPGAREIAAAGVAFLPAALALRGPEPRRLPRGRAHLDRHVRERRDAGAEGASSLWLAAHRADGRVVARGERRRIEGAGGHAQPHAARRHGGGDRRLGRGVLVGRPQPVAPARTRARAARASSSNAISRRPSRPADQLEVANAARDACLALERPGRVASQLQRSLARCR